MRVYADREVCIGAGNCVLAAPTIFDQDDDATVVVLDRAPPSDQDSALRAAVAQSPSGALSLGEQ